VKDAYVKTGKLNNPRRSIVRRRLGKLPLLGLCVLITVGISSQVNLANSDQPAVARATVTLARTGAPVPVPRSFFGLSTEYWSLPVYGAHLTLFEHVVRMLQVQGDGPMILRVGGDSADHTFWDPTRRGLPAWAFGVSPAWTRLTARIVHQLHLRLILDLNLISDSPATAVRWARAAHAGLPHGSIIGFEIGNEPDLYRRANWIRITRDELVDGRALPDTITAHSYLSAFRRYAARLHRLAPKVPLLGPAVSHPTQGAGWIKALMAARIPGLRTISVHRYPYSPCLPRWSASYPTVPRLLSEHASRDLADVLGPLVAAAHADELQFRLTELNSVDCGGRPGVSNTFATALWAPDALFELLGVGVNGVNLHIRADTINAPFALGSGGLTARPLLYGLLTFARTLSGAKQLVPLDLSAHPALHLKAWGLRTAGGGMHLLLINKGRRRVRIALRLPGYSGASVQRLLARGAYSRSGVTLAGQRLGPDATWLGRFRAQHLRWTRRGYVLSMPAVSAALVELPGTQAAYDARVSAPHAATGRVLGAAHIRTRPARGAARRRTRSERFVS
jgi:hypothetical protein